MEKTASNRHFLSLLMDILEQQQLTVRRCIASSSLCINIAFPSLEAQEFITASALMSVAVRLLRNLASDIRTVKKLVLDNIFRLLLEGNMVKPFLDLRQNIL